ncbi:MAG: SH3 domain-containing protein [Spirochaetia bacterium]|nr:SH3 domain-containing protein [Spirochaetia bacterium]
MTKINFIAFLLFCLYISLAESLYSQNTINFGYISNIKGAELMEKPDINSKNLMHLKYLTKFIILKDDKKVLKQSGSWYKIELNNKVKGFIFKKDCALRYRQELSYVNKYILSDDKLPINYLLKGSTAVKPMYFGSNINKYSRLSFLSYYNEKNNSYLFWLTEFIEDINSLPVSLILDSLEIKNVKKNWHWFDSDYSGFIKCRLKKDHSIENIVAFISYPEKIKKSLPIIKKVYKAWELDTFNRKIKELNANDVECYFFEDPEGI